MSNSDTPTVVLVHGAFVDGSGWHRVYEHLKKDGHRVSVVQNPTVSLADALRTGRRRLGYERRPEAPFC
jgi:hypothetical protein